MRRLTADLDPAGDRSPRPRARAPRRRRDRAARRALRRVGLLHLHLQHTSAGLALNENASPDVRADLESWLDRAVPDGAPYFRHTLEGADDMPAHVKSVLTGTSLTLPIAAGRPALGTWQGIYLCEFRDHGGARRVIATLHGED